MQIDGESLYLMLGHLISEMPDFSGYGPLSTNRMPGLAAPAPWSKHQRTLPTRQQSRFSPTT